MLGARAYKQLRRLSEAAIREETKTGVPFDKACESNRFVDDLKESLNPERGNLNPYEFSFPELFAETVIDVHGNRPGRSLIESWDRRKRGDSPGGRITEANVSTANFANIMGQIAYAAVLPAFEKPNLLWPMLARTVPTPFEQEKIPGISNPGDVTEAIPEQHPYPRVGIGEEFVETRVTEKHGAIINITKEAMFFDRTGLILDRARELAMMLSISKEKRVLDVALGLVDVYRRNGAAAIPTYGDASGTHDWDNLIGSNALVDETDIENALLAFDAITDPNTGEPVFIDLNNMSIIVPSALSRTLDRILNAIEVRAGDITAGAGLQTIAPRYSKMSPLKALSSPYVKERTSSDTTWFIGDFLNAVTYHENWPISTPPEAVSSHDEIHYDIVAGVKVTERGVANMMEPRRVAKNTQ